MLLLSFHVQEHGSLQSQALIFFHLHITGSFYTLRDFYALVHLLLECCTQPLSYTISLSISYCFSPKFNRFNCNLSFSMKLHVYMIFVGFTNSCQCALNFNCVFLF